MHLIHNGLAGPDFPIEHQTETQVTEQVEQDSQEQQEIQIIEVMAQS